jgi:hypothetical protein
MPTKCRRHKYLQLVLKYKTRSQKTKLRPFELNIDFTVEENLVNKAASLKNLNAFKSLGNLANLKNPDDCKPSGTIGKENITMNNSIL